jgi:hypothetical protein
VLASYLQQLGATSDDTAAALNTAHEAFLTAAPATTTYTFGNGTTLTLDQGSYSLAGGGSLNPGAVSLTTATGEAIGTLSLDPTTGAGTLTGLDGSTYNIAGGTSLVLTAPDAGSSALQVLNSDISELGAVAPTPPTYTPYDLAHGAIGEAFGDDLVPTGDVAVTFNEPGNEFLPGAMARHKGESRPLALIITISRFRLKCQYNVDLPGLNA